MFNHKAVVALFAVLALSVFFISSPSVIGTPGSWHTHTNGSCTWGLCSPISIVITTYPVGCTRATECLGIVTCWQEFCLHSY